MLVRRRTCVSLLALATLLVSVDAVPGGPEDIDPATREIVNAYIRDPHAFRREILVLAREAPPDLPAGVRLAFADAFIRSGRPRDARRVLTSVIDEGAGSPWTDWSYLALGWLEFSVGHFDAARAHYELAAETPLGGPIAPVVLGLVDAAARKPGAAEALEAATAGAPPAVRPVARIGVAYAHYWARDYLRAAAEFEQFALTDATSVLADDAAYAAAWARWRAGEGETARERLSAVAGRQGTGTNPKRIPSSLVELEPASLVRGSLKRYQRIPIGSPPDQLVALLDADGPGLARAALTLIDDRAAPLAGSAARTVAVDGTDARATPEVRGEASGPLAPLPLRPDGTPRSEGWLLLLGVLLLASIVTWWIGARRRSNARR